jgi:hypothetical protein
VYIKDKGADYNAIFKHVEDWQDWTELQGVKEGRPFDKLRGRPSFLLLMPQLFVIFTK